MSDENKKPIRFQCPHCSAVLKGRLSDAGQERNCPNCDQKFRIPRPKATAHVGKPKEDDVFVPVICGVCSTRMYATADQIGQSMECPDCFTQTLIKAPKIEAKPAAPNMAPGFGYDMKPAEEITVIKTLAEELLEEADRVVEQNLEDEPTTPDKPFLSGIFLYPFYARIFPVVLGMALAWAMVLGLVKLAWDQQANASLLAPFFFAAIGIVLLIVTFPTLVTLQKIFENTSNGDEDTDCRPEGGLLAYLDWVGDVIPLLIAVFVSCAPGMTIMRGFGLPPEYYAVMAFSAFLLFPIVLLSMLESASVTGMFSKVVWTSFGKVPGSWFKFYSLATVLFVLCGMCVGVLLLLSDNNLDGRTMGKGLAALVGVLVILTIYFRLLGRLAFVMTQKIMVEVFESEDASTSDLDESPENDAKVSLGI